MFQFLAILSFIIIPFLLISDKVAEWYLKPVYLLPQKMIQYVIPLYLLAIPLMLTLLSRLTGL